MGGFHLKRRVLTLSMTQTLRFAAVLVFFVSVIASPLLGQTRRHTTVVPAVGAGVMDRNGPQVSIGMQLQREFSDAVVVVAQISRWTAIGACTHEVSDDLDGCEDGLDGDVGVNFRINEPGRARPYVGIGAGVTTIGRSAPAINARFGTAVGELRGVSFHVELRTQRIFGKINAGAASLGLGVGFGF